MASFRITRKKPAPIGDFLPAVIRSRGIENEVIASFVIDAWAKVTPAPHATLSCYFSSGTLQVNLNSSLIRSELSFQKEALLASLNRILDKEDLVSALRKDENPVVNRLVFK